MTREYEILIENCQKYKYCLMIYFYEIISNTFYNEQFIFFIESFLSNRLEDYTFDIFLCDIFRI